MSDVPHPPIATREEWLKARLELLQREKAHTREYDAINAQRRRLPMVLVEREYRFLGPEGEVSLLDLFQGNRQLIVYHFMYGPDWELPCPGCTSWVDAIADLSSLDTRDVRLVLSSRASQDRLRATKEEKGWKLPWYTTVGSEFNLDFGVSIDPKAETKVYNYRPTEVTGDEPDDRPGLSVFFQLDGKVYHTYSTFQRGGESLVHSYALLDVTPFGRQEDFEDSPPGWPQRPTYG